MITEILNQLKQEPVQIFYIDLEQGQNTVEREFSFELEDYVIVATAHYAYDNIIGKYEDKLLYEELDIIEISLIDENGDDVIDDMLISDYEDLKNMLDYKIEVE